MSQRIHEVLERVFTTLPILTDERLEAFTRLERTMCIVEESAGGYAGKTVLELGAGSGAHACAAKELGAAQVIALDKFVYPTSDSNHFRLDSNTFIRLKTAWSSYGIETREADLNQIWDVKDASVDLVVSNAVFEHLHGSHRHFLAESLRVLKPGGKILLSTPNLAYLPKRIRFLLGMSPDWDLRDFFLSANVFTGHTREFTAQEMQKMIEWAGFRPLYCRSHVTYLRWAWLKQMKKIHRIPLALLSMTGKNFGDVLFVLASKPTNL